MTTIKRFRIPIVLVDALFLYGFLSGAAWSRESQSPKLIDRLRADQSMRLTGQNGQTNQVNDQANNQANKKTRAKALDQAYDDLDKAVQSLLKDPRDAELLDETVRLAAFTLKEDPSNIAAELLLPLFKADQASVEKSIQKLPEPSADLLLQAIRSALREEREGNG